MSFPPRPPGRIAWKYRLNPSGESAGLVSVTAELTIGPRFTGADQLENRRHFLPPWRSSSSSSLPPSRWKLGSTLVGSTAGSLHATKARMHSQASAVPTTFAECRREVGTAGFDAMIVPSSWNGTRQRVGVQDATVIEPPRLGF